MAMNDSTTGTLERVAPLLVGGALVIAGLSRRSLAGTALAVAGGSLAYRGLSHQEPIAQIFGRTEQAQSHGITVKRAMTVDRPAAELYEQWRNLENLPRFMAHLESVTYTHEGRSHWVLKLPVGPTIEWDAETIEDVPGERISWRSLPNATIQNAGTVRFKEAPGGRGTEVHVTLEYQPPGGVVGEAVGRLFEEVTAETLQNELRHFKQMMEAGEIATVEGQPHGPLLEGA